MNCWMHTPTNGTQKIRVVLPLCQKDGLLLLENLKWQCELDGVKDFEAVLLIETDTQVELMDACQEYAGKTYRNVQVVSYPRAPKSKWPDAPNWVFQHAARHMQRGLTPWFFMEPDCQPTKQYWLEIWNREYFLRKRAIMGFVIPSMGHCNGTAIYPNNFPMLCPEAMTCTDVAWDGLMKQKTIKLTADAPDLMCHVWGIRNGQAQICGGDPAVFMTQKNVDDWVNPNAILFHRAKDTTLIERLRERRGHFPVRILAAEPDAYREIRAGPHPALK